MIIFPAIDLYEGQAVRLLGGDYAQKTVYSSDPVEVAKSFAAAGAEYLHVVDLEGARDGGTPHLPLVERIVRESGLRVEVGGGIRTGETAARYLEAGVLRVILGTAAATDGGFLAEMVSRYGERIAVGADLRDGLVAVKGWTETTGETLESFCARIQRLGVRTLICTDISRDGAMRGANRELYARLARSLDMDIVASGGVSALEDVAALRALGLYGAILGRALYVGGIDLREALEAAR